MRIAERGREKAAGRCSSARRGTRGDSSADCCFFLKKLNLTGRTLDDSSENELLLALITNLTNDDTGREKRSRFLEGSSQLDLLFFRHSSQNLTNDDTGRERKKKPVFRISCNILTESLRK
ncbi:hypothetical protein NDU88_004414 [Pleurodeles waltl]|uniref:Uncharacterized protein n=1 Tax=Pleurodeles waltl TaxID=8319 RepID=A0AAV7W828_PLEWA|nr:hypothetical protein NDU88_004414 [Pleurodeles waltl]